ncbi:FliM/FliN family flagellar motor switch protein [Thermovibrio ammonificans]|jgi:flagellar motor switch protein FliN/FliY|uniref:Flagellar motor switch protein FliN n=1 Tax=Thermovibrio ammonificans (strain DSM 15698 / JCM 12110 / HB-1) TaxID=648996 RepID=E8T477_THEA1|nr:FliM/FliN family flagellar motor switch protein [Thermovibrio ammonificans]ADU97406.1 surface presentation of antigens (SPOA) protein [Thermovibrio ammonificans HB-1]
MEVEKELTEKLERFSDIELKISLVVGRKVMPFSKVLKLKEGDIITLDKKLDDYLEVTLNDQEFGIGELIVINDKVSLRLVDLV